jgi:hypothetical protein
MHWIFLAIIACLVFMASYNPRTGNLTKFFAPDVSVEDGKPPSSRAQRKAQSNSDTDE